jgi:hypothetical protein
MHVFDRAFHLFAFAYCYYRANNVFDNDMKLIQLERSSRVTASVPRIERIHHSAIALSL